MPSTKFVDEQAIDLSLDSRITESFCTALACTTESRRTWHKQEPASDCFVVTLWLSNRTSPVILPQEFKKQKQNSKRHCSKPTVLHLQTMLNHLKCLLSVNAAVTAKCHVPFERCCCHHHQTTNFQCHGIWHNCRHLVAAAPNLEPLSRPAVTMVQFHP